MRRLGELFNAKAQAEASSVSVDAYPQRCLASPAEIVLGVSASRRLGVETAQSLPPPNLPFIFDFADVAIMSHP